MADTFQNFPALLESPAHNCFAISPSNTADLPFVTRAIYIGGDGNLTVELVGTAAGSAVLFTGVKQGTVLPLRVRKVMATGTNAAALVGLY